MSQICVYIFSKLLQNGSFGLNMHFEDVKIGKQIFLHRIISFSSVNWILTKNREQFPGVKISLSIHLDNGVSFKPLIGECPLPEDLFFQFEKLKFIFRFVFENREQQNPQIGFVGNSYILYTKEILQNTLLTSKQT